MKNKFLLLGATALLSTMAFNANAGMGGGATINASISIVPVLDISNGTINFGKITTYKPEGVANVTLAINNDGSIDESNTTATVLALPSVTPARITAPDAALSYNESMYASSLQDELMGASMAIYEAEQSGDESAIAAAQASYNAVQAEVQMYNDLMGSGYSSSTYNGWTAELSNTTFNLTSGNATCGTVTLSTPKWKVGGDYDLYEETGESYVDLSYAGTFVLAPGYKPSSETSCTGSTTLTIISEQQ